MRMRYKDLLYLAHLHSAPLNLVLRRLATIKKPNVSIKPHGERRVVARRRRLCGRRAEESEANCSYHLVAAERISEKPKIPKLGNCGEGHSHEKKDPLGMI